MSTSIFSRSIIFSLEGLTSSDGNFLLNLLNPSVSSLSAAARFALSLG
jgi:hypothetical protein